MFVSMAFVIFGVILAWFEFGRKEAEQVGFVERIAALRALFAERWYLDHFYRWFVTNVIYKIFANLSARNDRQVIDGGIDGFCRFTVDSGRMLSHLQSGRLRYNLMVTFAVLALVALYFFFCIAY